MSAPGIVPETQGSENRPRISFDAEKQDRLVGLGSVLIFLGLLTFGLMWIGFGVVDGSYLEVGGGAGIIVAAIGALLVSLGSRRRPRP
jgi:Na+/phosphate symporter